MSLHRVKEDVFNERFADAFRNTFCVILPLSVGYAGPYRSWSIGMERTLEIAAAGNYHLLLNGPPGKPIDFTSGRRIRLTGKIFRIKTPA